MSGQAPPKDLVSLTQTGPTSPGIITQTIALAEGFPSLENEKKNSSPVFVASPSEIIPAQGSGGSAEKHNWPARKSSQWLGANPRTPAIGHRPRRSLSDAFNNIRARRGSVSENAQEIAEVLKAPLSYQLVVSVKIVYTGNSG